MTGKLLRYINRPLLNSCILCYQIYILLTHKYINLKQMQLFNANHETQSISEHKSDRHSISVHYYHGGN
jgi:hypothetical protein